MTANSARGVTQLLSVSNVPDLKPTNALICCVANE